MGLSAWAAQRWNIGALAVPGLLSVPTDRSLLNARRAQAVASLLRSQGTAGASVSGGGQAFRLVAAPTPESGTP